MLPFQYFSAYDVLLDIETRNLNLEHSPLLDSNRGQYNYSLESSWDNDSKVSNGIKSINLKL